MPQLSIYLDEDTLKKIELAAKIEETSISKYVVQKINESINKSWPTNFKNLFGSINDKTFKIPDKLGYNTDNKREKI